jgi:amino acid adenylation domain-containing protein
MSSEISSSNNWPAGNVAQLVRRRALEAPDSIALRAGSVTVTYGALDAEAARLAAYLRGLGVAREVPVGIVLERSVEEIVATLAVMKAGGAFLPLDPTWPVARLDTLLGDAGAFLVIARSSLADRLQSGARIVVDLDRITAASKSFNADQSDRDIDADDLAYIIYTSGSSGGPKGVEITHGNLLNLVSWHQETFGVTPGDRGSHIAGLGFDASVWEVWPYLASGASVALPEEIVGHSPELLRDWLVEAGITIAFAPTALAEPLIATEWPATTSLRLLLTGGEALRSYPRPGLPFAVVNNYGPTECTVVASSGTVSPHATAAVPPSIGRAIANTRIFLLDERGDAVRDGEIGEIYIAGASVGRGYRGRPSRSEPPRFLPRGTISAAAEFRLYRTGDLGRLLPDGTIAFCGRVDDQIKLRGHRVGPDEIATALNRHPAIASSVIVAHEGPSGETRLTAYFVPRAEPAPSVRALRAFLAATLPDYMVPSAFVRLAEMPLTANGKIDRAALRPPTQCSASERLESDAASSPTERRLIGIIVEVSSVQHVSASDNFFLIGGHSLSGAQVVVRARDAFGVDLTLRHLFEAKTVGDLAATIEKLAIERLATMSEEEAQQILEKQS